jgi:hypothetical protein
LEQFHPQTEAGQPSEQKSAEAVKSLNREQQVNNAAIQGLKLNPDNRQYSPDPEAQHPIPAEDFTQFMTNAYNHLILSRDLKVSPEDNNLAEECDTAAEAFGQEKGYSFEQIEALKQWARRDIAIRANFTEISGY